MDDRMGAVLVQAGKISQKQLDAALAAQRETGGRLDSKLVGLGYLKDHELVDFLSKHFGVPAVDLGQHQDRRGGDQDHPRRGRPQVHHPAHLEGGSAPHHGDDRPHQRVRAWTTSSS